MIHIFPKANKEIRDSKFADRERIIIMCVEVLQHTNNVCILKNQKNLDYE